MKKEKVDKKRARDGEGQHSGKKVRYSEELIVPASPPQIITKPPVSIMKNKSMDKKSESKDSAKITSGAPGAIKSSAKDAVKDDAKAKSSAKDAVKDDAKAKSSAKDAVKDDTKAKSSAKDAVKDDAKAKSSAKDAVKDDAKAKSSAKKDTDSEASKSVKSSELSVASSTSHISVASSKVGKTATKAQTPVKASKGKNGGKISLKNEVKDSNNAEPTNNIYIGHIPDGFEEKEMRSFFKQFGDVRKVKLFRSAKTNRSRGYAFAQFKDKDVAKIVADTMNGYLIMGRQLVCHVIPQGKCHDGMYKRKYNKELIGKPRDTSNDDDDD